MNNCYTHHTQYSETERGTEAITRIADRADRFLDAFFSCLMAIVAFLSRREVRTAIRYAVVTICFFCFIGLVGGIEKGLISVGLGIFCGLGLIFVEVLCLK